MHLAADFETRVHAGGTAGGYRHYRLLAGLLLPKLGAVRESGRRVNCLSNLNGIFKSCIIWSLDPETSFAPPFPQSQLTGRGSFQT